MKVHRRNLTLGVPLLLAAVAPLHAQFTTYGCPASPNQQLNGFTAGTVPDSRICLNASPTAPFQTSGVYNVTLVRTDTSQSVTVTGTAQSASLEVTVPANFYSAVSNQTVPVPVNVNIVAPQFAGTAQTGTFQINPPLAFGSLEIGAVNNFLTVLLSANGTAPYTNQFLNGTFPNGMSAFPTSGQIWNGTPTQTGVFTFTINASDAWGNSVTSTVYVYITPQPQISSPTLYTEAAGSGNVSININGSGFLAPITLGTVPVPGSSVLLTQGLPSAPLTLTPTSYSANQLAVTIPASALTNTGFWAIVVQNPGGGNSSNGVILEVTPSITGLSTYTRTVGTTAFPLTVTGAGFVSGSVVKTQAGVSLPTTFVSSTVLTATFPSEPAIGPVELEVQNPDGTVSPLNKAEAVTILEPPAPTALSPSSTNSGGPAFTLIVSGSFFQSGDTIYFNSIPLPTTLVSIQGTNSLVATVPGSAIASAGTVPVWVSTPDGYTSRSLSFTIISTIPPLTLVTPAAMPSGVVNTAYTATFSATGGAGGNTFSLSNGALPPGLQLSSAGVISGTPTAFGTFSFTVQVTDLNNNTASSPVTIKIAPLPLTLTTGPLANTQVNTPISIQFAGSGGIPPYTFVEFGPLPPGIQISSSGLLSGTPTKAGSYPFLLYLDDSTQASVSKNYTLNVALPGLLITPPSPLPSGQINVPYTTQLAATGGAGAPFTWSATGLPQGLAIASNTGLISGIPRAAGSFTLGVTVGDSSGAMATQSYALTIAPSAVSIVTQTLANGAVGSAYSGAVSASGGSGTYTFTATGLPPGVTLASSGTLTGTPTAAGSYTVAVTATDASGLTAVQSFSVTITGKLVVTPATISNAIVGVPITAVTLTATGGTPPYQWQSATLPPGFSLALNGTLTGTPAAAGTFSFTDFVVDNNGTLASGTGQVTVALPTAPSASITGLPPTSAPASQPSLEVALANPYPATITANLTLTFAPFSGADDPSIQFSGGGRTAQVVIPAGNTAGVTNVGVQTGTVAGTITITAQLFAGTVNVTPTPAPSQSITVTAGAPVITGVTAARTSTGFTVTVTGYASNRDVDTGAYRFSGSDGANLVTNQLSTSITSLFTQWYGSSSSAPFGSQFTLTQPFTVNGSPSSVLSVTVTLTNALGTSPAATANLQ
jgi:hypothetical protein